MDAKQQNAIKKCMPKFVNELDVTTLTLQLRALSVLTPDDMEIIQSKTTAAESRLEFLSILQRRDHAWEYFMIELKKAGQKYLGKCLIMASEYVEVFGNQSFRLVKS